MCLFCQIANHEIPSNTVYEDDNFIIILDTVPLTKGHTLLIPKEHYTNIFDTPDIVLQELIIKTKELALNYLDQYNMKGFNLVVNNNYEGHQTINHLHFHLIPRYDHDELNYLSKKR